MFFAIDGFILTAHKANSHFKAFVESSKKLPYTRFDGRGPPFTTNYSLRIVSEGEMLAMMRLGKIKVR